MTRLCHMRNLRSPCLGLIRFALLLMCDQAAGEDPVQQSFLGTVPGLAARGREPGDAGFSARTWRQTKEVVRIADTHLPSTDSQATLAQ
jgi:hypothetical protein